MLWQSSLITKNHRTKYNLVFSSDTSSKRLTRPMSGYTKQIVLTSVVAGVLIVSIGLGLYYAPFRNASGSTTSSLQNNIPGNQSFSGAGNLTAVATYVSTFTAQTSTLFSTATSSVSTSSSSTGESTTYSFSFPPRGTFTYSPDSPVKVLAMNATLNQAGNQRLSFSVEFQNVGNSTIYIAGGGGSSLSVTILSGPVHSRNLPKCEIASFEIPVNSGQTHTSYTPGCWSGYDYVLWQPGIVMVRLTLNWSANAVGGLQGGVTVITAEFSFN